MLDFLYSVIDKSKKSRPLVRKFVKLFINIFYPCITRFSRKKLYHNNNNIIVSLTTYSSRARKVWVTLETIIRQTVQPEKVIVWLDEKEFNPSNIPYSIKRMINKGIEVKYCENLKPHKKYFYTMLEYPNHNIITIDDDTFYPNKMVEDFINVSINRPGHILCNVAKGIEIKNNIIEPYASWRTSGIIKINNSRIVPIGVGGVFYPPNSLHKEVFNKKNLIKTSLYADDLWLKVMGTINGTPYFLLRDNWAPINFISHRKTGLTQINVDRGGNDKQLMKIISLYPEFRSILITENNRI